MFFTNWWKHTMTTLLSMPVELYVSQLKQSETSMKVCWLLSVTVNCRLNLGYRLFRLRTFAFQVKFILASGRPISLAFHLKLSRAFCAGVIICNGCCSIGVLLVLVHHLQSQILGGWILIFCVGPQTWFMGLNAQQHILVSDDTKPLMVEDFSAVKKTCFFPSCSSFQVTYSATACLP